MTDETRIEANLAKFFDAMNRHDAAAAVDLYGPEAVVHDPQYPEPLKGRDAVEKDIAEFFRAFPDLRMEMKQSIVTRDRYAVQYRMTGTHKGPLEGPGGTIPATDRSVDIGGATISRLDGEGRVSEDWRYYDFATMLMQLGLFK